MSQIIEDLNWRYATKKFDPSKKVSDQDLHVIKESLRLTPTSYGLQPIHFLIVENEDIRSKLVDASYGQRQIADASHLIVLCSYIQLKDEHVDQYMNLVAATREVDIDKLSGFSNMIKNTSLKLDLEDQQVWMGKQAYIALGHLMHTCASLRIDSTPMEGFNSKEYDQILGLSDRNLHAVLACPIGYRHQDDQAQHQKKVRKSSKDIFEII